MHIYTRYFFITVLCILFVGVGCSSSQSETQTHTTAPASSSYTTEQEDIPYEVSIQGFAQREFEGTDFTLGHVLADNSIYTRYYITYKSNGLTISGIMNIPKGEGPYPVVFLNHGYIDPAIYTNGRGLKREQDYLARNGYAVVHSDYRNHAQSDKDTNVDVELRLGYAEDVVNGIRALQQADIPQVDSARIGMLGHSMGGGVALQIMTALPEIADAYVLFAPVSADARDNFDKWIRNSRPAATSLIETYGDFEENSIFWNGISPNQYFNRIQQPVMYHHGTLDESVPLEWSDSAVAQMQEAEVDVTYYVYEGEKHEFINQWPLVMERTKAFFDEHLQ